MTATEYHKTQIASLKVIGTTAEAPMHAIPGQSTLPQTDNPAGGFKTNANIFNIAFTYQGQRHQTKVLKVGNRNDEVFYKVVLGSYLCPTHNMCWLQRKAEGWAVLLGMQTSPALIATIANAIEQHSSI